MKICIDLDNTILDHSSSFNHAMSMVINSHHDKKKFYQKEEIKKIAINDYDLETWLKIQGLVYGKLINLHCKLYEGFRQFCIMSSLLDYKIYIVSHKTKAGHYLSKKINLRVEALNKLMELLGDQKKLIYKIYFCETLEEKIDKINSISPDKIIDDLEKVLLKINNKNKNKFLFSENEKLRSKNFQVANWNQINHLFFFKKQKYFVSFVLDKFLFKAPNNLKKISEGSNSITYKFKDNNLGNLKFKMYLNENFNTFAKEKKICQILDKDFEYINSPIFSSKIHKTSIFKWEKGKKIDEINNQFIDESLNFLFTINQSKYKKKLMNIGPASAACLSGIDAINQLIFRNKSLLSNNSYSYEIVDQINMLVRKKIKLINDVNFLKYTSKINKKEYFISPSDFGKHNAIKYHNKYKFFDFEYFGYDDPIKLISDFYFHPAMNLNKSQKEYWLRSFILKFSNINLKRLYFLLPIYGLIWTHIILKDLDNNFWFKKKIIKNLSDNDRESLIKLQSRKAKKILVDIKIFEDKYKESYEI